MTNRLMIAAIIAASSASAYAGYKATVNVTVTTSQAYGAMGTTRNSADAMQYIGCETYATTSYSHIFCRARNASGATLYCWQDLQAYPAMASVAASIAD